MKYRLIASVIPGSVCAVLAACAVPATLKAPEGQVLVRSLHATGVQIYVCQAVKDNPLRLDWTFKAPQADLFDRGGNRVGEHYAGPCWEGKDGSKVVGSLVAKESPDPKSIPWLLLSAQSTTGKGIFSDVRSIQRIRTVGGLSPSGGCNQGQLGQELKTAYSADYLFYR